MKTLVIGILITVHTLGVSQAQGIQFDSGMTWQQVQGKANKENKFIFLDFYATWCGPCKQMDRNVFTRNEVGDFFNSNFISVKVQVDTTAKDNDQVRKWYGAAARLNKQFEVATLPTYIFLSPSGVPVHRSAKGAMSANDFIEVANSALDSSKQYYTLLAQYKNGRRDAEFIRRLATVAHESGDKPLASTVAQVYIKQLPDAEIFTKENLEFIAAHTDSNNDRGFNIFLSNMQKINDLIGALRAENLIRSIIRKEDINSVIYASIRPDWKKLGELISKKYKGNDLAMEALAGAQMIYCQRAEDWQNFVAAYTRYYTTALKRNEYSIESLSRSVLENIHDTKTLEFASEIVKVELEGSSKDDPMLMDVYAGLLYTLHRKDEATQWQMKALDLDADNEGMKERLRKMEKGEKIFANKE